MGNFSVNHYSKLEFGAKTVQITYVLDLAEIPTFELLAQWQIHWKNSSLVEREARQQAELWLSNIELSQNGTRSTLRIGSVHARATEGAGGMPVLRIATTAETALRAGEVSYEDRNFPGRTGWKEIVVRHDGGAAIRSSFDRAPDASAALTRYPADATVAPPQDLTARIEFAPVTAGPRLRARPPVMASATSANPVAVVHNTESTFSQQQPVAAGTVVRGDYLSRMLGKRDIGWGMMLLGILAAFGIGAMHALSPGHGKTIVAAYLVGSRGTLRHAALLGFVVTFTHTFTVFLLGLGVLFFQQYVVPEKIMPVLGAISGLSIVCVGALLLYRRARALTEDGHDHGHSHSHSHPHEHHHAHHDGHHHHDHNHDHHPYVHTHSHGGHTHTHTIDGKVTLGSLVALGVSGGLVPCPSALILMLSAIALGRPALGLLLLIGFSTGLAAVLMGIGFLVIYAKHLLPDSKSVLKSARFRLIPVFSAVVVICLGLAMAAVSVGWIQPLRFLA